MTSEKPGIVSCDKKFTSPESSDADLETYYDYLYPNIILFLFYWKCKKQKNIILVKVLNIGKSTNETGETGNNLSFRPQRANKSVALR